MWKGSYEVTEERILLHGMELPIQNRSGVSFALSPPHSFDQHKEKSKFNRTHIADDWFDVPFSFTLEEASIDFL